MLIRVRGKVSSDMALLMRRRAGALQNLGRFKKARYAAVKSLELYEQDSGRTQNYIQGMDTLALIFVSEGKLKEALKLIEEARSLYKPQFDPGALAAVLNTHALILETMERYQDAVLASEEALALRVRIDGLNHPNYAASCLHAAFLYMRLKQVDRAVDLATRALDIYMRTIGPSHPLTNGARAFLANYQKALINPDIKKALASKSDRMCNIGGCHTVQKNMSRCLKCLAHYLCKDHEKLIDEHVAVCPKFPDVLPDEKKLDKIVKCRRCRKQTMLMKCSVCESVWYCGAACQKEDWKRHKLFCGKK